MDERLANALDHSNYMITLENQKRLLKELYEDSLIHFHNKGQFTVSLQLVSSVQSLVSMNQTDIVLVDDNSIPIQIESLKTFLIEILNVYHTATNSYLQSYNELIARKGASRTVSDLV